MKFHHFGLAVKKFKQATKFYRDLNYKIGNKIIDNKQSVEIILCTSSKKPTIELIRPIGKNNPVKNYLEKFNEIFYHSCYEVKDFTSIKKFLKKHNAKCVSPPTAAKAYDNRRVTFYYIKDVGLVEFLEIKS